MPGEWEILIMEVFIRDGNVMQFFSFVQMIFNQLADVLKLNALVWLNNEAL